MSKRERTRIAGIVRGAVRRSRLSPEAFAARHAAIIYGASARTLRRWMAGEFQRAPHAVTVESLRRFSPDAR